MENFGSYIKAHREKRGIRLEEIASITKIHLRTLEMLELSDWENLPSEPFIRGFIVAYGKYVGMDPKDLIERYVVEVGESSSQNITPPQDVSESGRETPGDVIEHSGPLPSKKLLLGLGVAGLVAIFVTLIMLGKSATEAERQAATEATTLESEMDAEASETLASEETAPQTSTTPSDAASTAESPAKVAQSTEASSSREPSDSPTVTPSKTETVEAKTEAPAKTAETEKPAPPPTPPAPPAKHRLSVQAKEATWIKIVIDEKKPIEYLLPKGQKVYYRAADKIKVVLGNATDSRVTHNGKEVEGAKFLGTMRSYTFPEDASFPQDSNRNPSSRPAGRPTP